MSISEWIFVIGFGVAWLGGLIMIVIPDWPRQLRKGETPSAPPGSPEAYGLFWMDQYGYIGIVLFLIGVLGIGYGLWS
tara:strand:+ start:181 stop:414 length:234 start_codon:yes stop_codon:yes gene_type:complete